MKKQFVVTRYESNGEPYDHMSNEYPIKIINSLEEVKHLVEKEGSVLVEVEEEHYLREMGCKYTYKELKEEPVIFVCPYDKGYLDDCITSQECLNHKKTSDIIAGSMEETIFLACLKDQERSFDKSWAEYRVYEVKSAADNSEADKLVSELRSDVWDAAYELSVATTFG